MDLNQEIQYNNYHSLRKLNKTSEAITTILPIKKQIMADSQSTSIYIHFNGKEISIELDEDTKEKIVSILKCEYKKCDLRKVEDMTIMSNYYEISIKKLK